ncbi:hypothetical protein K3725_09695 [Leisingera sp. S132]|uniref:hypothetical protein n=1 Tax=Leisingera sp. S132 TaxID=2867016 RepID=UPI0021A51C7E|nr:hypothetical protein [Leisingera sp. S132]UWQ77596.1 hypothetical protein K3725_09695 [Leisingera sp. S132]
MTTLYTNRIAFLAPIEHAEACNRAANALGRSGQNFIVELSPDGAGEATHKGASTKETDAFLHVLSFAPGLPPGMAWPDGLAPGDWQAVADHLVVVTGPASSTDPAEQFDTLIAAHGLQRIEPDA